MVSWPFDDTTSSFLGVGTQRPSRYPSWAFIQQGFRRGNAFKSRPYVPAYAETNTGTRMASWPSQQPTFLVEANPTPPTPHTMFGPALHHIAAGSFETTPLTQYRWELVCKECMGFAYRTNSGPSNPTGNHSPPLTGPGPGPGTDNQGSRTLSNHHFYRFTKYHGHGQWGPPRETDAPGLAPGRTSDRRVPRPVEGAVGGDLVGVGRRAGASWLVGTS